MIKYTFTFLIILHTLVGLAQSYSEGGIIIKGDTTKGWISINNNANNAEICQFRTDETTESTNYTPEQLDGYYLLNGKHYISKQVEIARTSRYLFLEYLVNGIVDLFYFTENSKEFYFIEYENGIHLLSSSEKQVFVNGEHKIKNGEEYKGALKYILKDTPKMFPVIDQTSFSTKSLIKLTTKYHNTVCDEYACIDYTKSIGTSFELTPFLGANNLIFSTTVSDGAITSISPKFGLRFNFGSADSGKPIRYTTGIAFSTHQLSDHIDADPPSAPAGMVDHIVEVDFIKITIPIGINYHFDTPQKGLYLSTTAQFSIIKSTSSALEYYYPPNREYYERDSEFDGSTFGATIGLGYRINLRNQKSLDLKWDNSYEISSRIDDTLYSSKQFFESTISVGYTFHFEH